MPKRTTIYLDPKLHHAVKIKAVQMHISVSELVNEAVRVSLKEDASDLAAVRERISEPSRAYEAVLKDLKKDGLL
ncbi:MAG: CopG family transcriptional regulator [Candidatus Omnitrophica bacterium]|nr:CopG family transcriptional regulator [Candidatus Omnitrophota bacterium]